jgi:hypothetical protein
LRQVKYNFLSSWCLVVLKYEKKSERRDLASRKIRGDTMASYFWLVDFFLFSFFLFLLMTHECQQQQEQMQEPGFFLVVE